MPTSSRHCQCYVEIVECVIDNIVDIDWVSIRFVNAVLMSGYIDGVVKDRSRVTDRQFTIELSVISH